jgi:SpoIIAA-like
MIETLDGMEPGTLGFRATGKVTGAEYRDVLLPAMRAAAEAGDVRLVFVVGPGFEAFEPGALLEDAKTGIKLGFGHLSAWKRTALVTDVEWISKAFHMFAWMAPGEVLIRGLDGLDEAKAWVAGRAAE